MIRRPNPSAALPGRAGMSIPTIIVYLTVSAAILGIGTMTVHSVLQSEQRIRAASLLLQSLQQLEELLEHDFRTAVVQELSSDRLQLQNDQDSISIVWTVSQSRLDRVERSGDTVQSRDRMIFPAGCRLQFGLRDDGGFDVIVREGYGTVRYPAAGDGGTILHQPDAAAWPRPPRGTAEPKTVSLHFPESRLQNIPEGSE